MLNQHFVIAVVGLAGSGKTEVVRYLESKGLPKVYFGAPVFEELTRRGLPISEANERVARLDLRKTHGMAAMAILCLPEIEKLYATNHVVIESHYSWEEYLVLRERFDNRFMIIAVYAPPGLRYARLRERSERPLTQEEAWSRDKSQIEDSHQAGPIAMADYTIDNQMTLKYLYEQTEKAYQDILSFDVDLE
jgi:dephospho-CoA kinase